MNRFLIKITAAGALFASGLGSVAAAQTPAPIQVRGKVVAVAPDSVKVASQGAEVQVALPPEWVMVVVAPASLSSIKPGSFVGTTNVDVPDGGVAKEIHIFPPGVKLGEGQRVMDAGTATRMTNGTVQSAAPSPAAPKAATRMTNGGVTSVKANSKSETVLEMTFPGGTRRVHVPADAVITTFTPSDRALLKPGIMVSVVALRGADGKLAARFVSTGPNGTAPIR